jgi:hypothetical protein
MHEPTTHITTPEPPLDGALPVAGKGVNCGPSGGFVIFALPRSRTAWLSHFLTYGEWHCGHEEVRHLRSLDDVKAWFAQPCTGTIETAAASFWRMIPDGVRVATIRRPVAEVVESLMRIPGCAFDREAVHALMTRLDRKLDQIEARIPGCLSVRYADLADEAACAALFEHCLPYRHDSARWASLAPINVQIDMRALIRYCTAYAPALEKLAATARHRSLASLQTRRPVVAEGLTIQTEHLETWRADAQRLFEEHCATVGEDPGEWRDKNWTLMEDMDRLGMMQITTARCNGRMFGYLMTLVTPSLSASGKTSGTHTTFFADPAFPGLGMKLQRAALASLKERGVDEVFWEAGKRGSGPRLGAMYRRLGAADHGETFRLALSEAA